VICRKKTAAVSLSALLAIASAPAFAQSSAAPLPADQLRARRDVAAFESVLEQAVGYGAQMLSQHVQTAATPESVLLTGMARARGFRLAGYGVVVDVEFPSIRRSVAWTMRTLEKPDPELLAAMKELRKNTQAFADPRTLQEMDHQIKALESQIKAENTRPKTVAAQVATPEQAAVSADEPRIFYAAELTNALVNAMLDHGVDVGIAPNEWLTVAARESLDLRFLPDDPPTTLILRIKGSDLQAFRDKTLPREEALKRFEVKQY
jgi:hypothetical protein